MTTPDGDERTAPAEVERVVSAVLGSMAYMGTSGRTLIVRILRPACTLHFMLSVSRCTCATLHPAPRHAHLQLRQDRYTQVS